jgi:hypothetical protein
MIDIARKDFDDVTVSISVSANPDGSIRVEGGDVGNSVKEWHGDGDYEYWVDVPASEIKKLVVCAEYLNPDVMVMKPAKDRA